MNIIKPKKGMTIVEVIVAMGIFITVVTLAVGGFVALLRLQRKSLIMRETQQNSRIALEIMAKDARQATTVTPSGSTLTLIMPGGTPITYALNGSNQITRRVGAAGIAIPITSSDITILATGLTFTNSGGDLLLIKLTATNNSAAGSVYDQDTTDLETSVIMEGTKQ